jgi:hypothetical protein
MEPTAVLHGIIVVSLSCTCIFSMHLFFKKSLNLANKYVEIFNKRRFFRFLYNFQGRGNSANNMASEQLWLSKLNRFFFGYIIKTVVLGS